jgi:hypothetical protein
MRYDPKKFWAYHTAKLTEMLQATIADPAERLKFFLRNRLINSRPKRKKKVPRLTRRPCSRVFGLERGKPWPGSRAPGHGLFGKTQRR